MTTEEAYRILSVEPGASPKEVQAAYRKRALELHPDRAGSEKQAQYFYRRFLEVRDAYEHLRREGFPVPEPEAVVPDIAPRTWTAGRSFAPRKDVDEVGQLQKLGIEFNVHAGSLFLWLILIPGGALLLIYFIKWLLGRLT